MTCSPDNDEIGIGLFQPPCTICGKPSATIKIVSRPDGVHLINSSPGGRGEVRITPAQSEAIAAALTPPYTLERIRSAGFYDDAGFCRYCERFYCVRHWNLTSFGSGTCPRGHFKSLDPHWRPDW